MVAHLHVKNRFNHTKPIRLSFIYWLNVALYCFFIWVKLIELIGHFKPIDDGDRLEWELTKHNITIPEMRYQIWPTALNDPD